MSFQIDSRSTCGLVAPDSRSRIPGPVQVCTAHYNGPPMNLKGRPHSECRARWKGIQKFHMASPRDWVDIAYTNGVCFHEIILMGRGPNVRTAANGTNTGNNVSYATFFTLGGDEQPTPGMLAAAAWYARTHLGQERWEPHSFWKSTACPGPLKKSIRNGRLIVPSTPTPPEEDDVYVIKFDDGPKDPRVKRAQIVLRTAGKEAGEGDLLPKFGTDGHYGDETRDAVNVMAKRAGLPQDGDKGMDVLLLDYCRNWLSG